MDFLQLKKRIDESGISYDEYIKKTVSEVSEADTGSLSPSELQRLKIKSLNLQRGSRISRFYKPGDELSRILKEFLNHSSGLLLQKAGVVIPDRTFPI